MVALVLVQMALISIHASAREATRFDGGGIGLAEHFNPRLRAGGDECQHALFALIRISIHASAREATIATATGPYAIAQFQSTPPRGRRRWQCRARAAF